MRALQVLPALEVGGAELVASWLATQVQETDPDVTTVMALAGGPLAVQLTDLGVRHRVVALGWISRLSKAFSTSFWRRKFSERFGANKHNASKNQRTLFVHRLRQDAEALKTLLRREKVQVVHFHFISTLHLAAVAKRHGCRVIYTHHNTISQRHGQGDIEFLASASRYLDQVICVSQSSATDLVRSCGLAPGLVTVISNPTLSLPAAIPTIRQHEEFVIGTASNLGPVKRIDVLLDAAKRLHADSSLRPWRVSIAGGQASAIAPWVARAQGDGLSFRVNFLGSLARANMPDFYNGLSCLVICSESEASPLQGIEAMSFGVPALCSDIPSLRDTFGPDAIYFEMGNAQALASALSRLMQNPEAGMELGCAARSRWETQYHPHLIREQYFRAYRGIA
jgi:glycosyltransferase involved in cell wall biosynthesis